MPLSRRSVLKAGVTAGVSAFAVPFDRVVRAEDLSTRYSATSKQGKAMLAKYATAVAAMMDASKFPPSDPRSWNFQWYAHWIPGPAGPWSAVAKVKADTIDKVFKGKPATDPHRTLAEAMWDNCQAHGYNPSDPNFFQETYFCVWHRWYVYYFEQIVRAVLNDASFTLPYWDYLSGNVADLSIPEEFRDPKSALYRANRNSWVNAGERIDKQNPGAMNLNALKEPAYITSGGTGFCPAVDGNPHGLVHVFVGDGTNMGSVPYAAGDPIFWLHHSNIDRLWESWNRVGTHTNPAWSGRTFPFANGQGTAVSAAPVDATRTDLLKYQYDSYAAAPKAPVKLLDPARLTDAGRGATTLALAASPVRLGTGRARVELQPPPSLLGSGEAASRLIDRASAGGRLYLTLGDLSAATGTLSTYNVFVGLPDGAAAPDPASPHYAGTVHFFNASPEGHAHDPAHAPFAFNVSERAGAMLAQGRLAPSITFVRHGDEEARPPSVGRVLLVEA